MTTLQTKARNKKDSLEEIRKQGLVPAVYYGSGIETKAITVSEKDFRSAYHQAGESTVVTLKTDEGDLSVLIQDYQLHPVNSKIMHVDFKVVKSDVLIEVNIPLEFIGEAPIEMGDQGTVTKVIHEVTVEALPKDLPHSLEVDLSVLAKIGDSILAKDIKLPKNVTLVGDKEEVIVVTSGVRDEEPEEVSTEIDFSSIQTEKESKKKEEPEEDENE